MKTSEKMGWKYLYALRDGGLPLAWTGLSKPRKRYAHELVERFGWSVRMAIQQVYSFPYDQWIFDYHDRSAHQYEVNRRTGHIGKRIPLNTNSQSSSTKGNHVL